MIAKEKAELVLQFMRLLKDPKGGSLTKRQTIQWLPWQEKFFTDIFATLNVNGTRQYREAFVEIPRKNGKSTMIAAYGEPDRISVATSGNLMGLSISNLITGNLQNAIPFTQFMGTRDRRPAFK